MQRKESNAMAVKWEPRHFYLSDQTFLFFLVFKNCLAGCKGVAGCPGVDGIMLLWGRQEEEETNSRLYQKANIFSKRNYFTADKCVVKHMKFFFYMWEKFINLSQDNCYCRLTLVQAEQLHIHRNYYIHYVNILTHDGLYFRQLIPRSFWCFM